MDSNNFHLIRMILIDSYAKNKTVEINLQGHTAISGENASGKTTLLRLITLFFGEAPSRIIATDENNKKFSTHHFHSLGSYVIFEYERRGSKVLSVLHPEGQSDKVIYRLIDSPYRDDLFKDDFGGRIQSSELTKHLTKKGVFISKPLNMTIYRQVIQNDLARQYADPEYRKLPSRFSFAGSGTRLKHLERVVTAILKRETSFIDLKRMIVSSVMESETISMRTSKRELIRWIDEYEAHHDLMKKAEVMQTLEEQDTRRRHIEGDFARLHAGFHLLFQHYLDLVQKGEARETEMAEQRAQMLRGYETTLLQISDDLGKQTSAIKTATANRDGLDQQHKHYAQIGADAKEQRVLSLDAMRLQKTQTETNLKELEGEASNVAKVYERMESEARTAADEAIRLQAERRTNALTKLSSAQQTLFAEQSQTMATVRDEQAVALKRLSDAVTELKVEEGRLSGQAGNPQGDPLLKENADIEAESLVVVSDSLGKLHEATRGFETTLNHARLRFTECETLRNATTDAIEALEIEREELVTADQAGEDTLLGFLRLNKPNWANDIGRLVSDQTLLRKDLTPTLGDGENLYGIGIDLEKLPSGRLSSEEEIQRAIAKVDVLLTKRHNELVEDDRRLTEAADKRKKAEAALNGHQQAIDQTRTSKAAQGDRATTAKRRWQDSVEQARKAVNDKLATCRTQLAEANRKLASTVKENDAAIATLARKHQEDVAKLKAEHEQAVLAIDTGIKQAKETLTLRLASIATDRDAAMAEHGVDTAKLKPLRDELKKLTKEIGEAEADRTLVAEYRNWLDHIWPRRSQYEEDLAEAQRQHKKFADLKADTIEHRTATLQKHDAAAQVLTDEINRNAGKQRHANAQMGNLALWPKDEATLAAGLDESVSLEVMSNRRAALQAEYAEIQTRIREAVNDIRVAMMSRLGSGPERYHLAAIQQYGHPLPGKEYQWIEPLRGWFNHEHTNNLIDLIQMGKSMAQNISTFWKTLGHFQKEVGNFGADLRAHLVKGKIFANIEDVSVTINADVNKQGYWQAIEALHFEYDHWHGMGANSLPPPSFVEAARDVANVLSEDHGLVAEPVDLINLQISATINGEREKKASDEAALKQISSNGLSYIILCVILIGFINRIRRKERVVVPFLVDELGDLSKGNAAAMLNLLADNDITMISAFPDFDPKLAALFARNYQVREGRVLARAKSSEEIEVAHV